MHPRHDAGDGMGRDKQKRVVARCDAVSFVNDRVTKAQNCKALHRSIGVIQRALKLWPRVNDLLCVFWSHRRQLERREVELTTRDDGTSQDLSFPVLVSLNRREEPGDSAARDQQGHGYLRSRAVNQAKPIFYEWIHGALAWSSLTSWK
jgi:hypothetical protein